MAYPTLSYNIQNGDPLDATRAMQNWTDLLNGTTDGTKDACVSVMSAATGNFGRAVIAGSATVGGDLYTVSWTAYNPTIQAYATHTVARMYKQTGKNVRFSFNLDYDASGAPEFTCTLPVSAATNTIDIYYPLAYAYSVSAATMVPSYCYIKATDQKLYIDNISAFQGRAAQNSTIEYQAK